MNKQTGIETVKDNKVKIKKAKIKDDLFLEVEYLEELPGHSKKDTKLTCTVPIHEDLKTAFEKLHVHLAIICDQETAPKKKDFEHTEFPGYYVRGFSIGGNDDSLGVTVSGSMDGTYGTVNLNTPFTKYEGADYPFTGELGADIEAAIYEIEQYLFHGKRAPEKQLGFDFGEGKEGDQQGQAEQGK